MKTNIIRLYVLFGCFLLLPSSLLAKESIRIIPKDNVVEGTFIPFSIKWNGKQLVKTKVNVHTIIVNGRKFRIQHFKEQKFSLELKTVYLMVEGIPWKKRKKQLKYRWDFPSLGKVTALGHQLNFYEGKFFKLDIGEKTFARQPHVKWTFEPLKGKIFRLVNIKVKGSLKSTIFSCKTVVLIWFPLNFPLKFFCSLPNGDTA